MAMSVRQSKSATAAAANGVTATFTSTAAARNMLVAFWIANATPGTVTDPSGWTAVTAENTLSPWIHSWWKVADGTETACVVATVNAVTQDLFVVEVQGFRGLPVLGRSASTSAAGGVTSRSTGTTPETTRMEGFAVAAVGANGSTSAASWSNSFNNEAGAASSRLYLATKALTAMATVETTLSWTTSRAAAGAVVTVRDSNVEGFLA